MRVQTQRSLSPAQSKVIKLRLEGKTFREIGKELNIHYRTAKRHSCDGMARLGVDIFDLARLWWGPLDEALQ